MIKSVNGQNTSAEIQLFSCIFSSVYTVLSTGYIWEYTQDDMYFNLKPFFHRWNISTLLLLYFHRKNSDEICFVVPLVHTFKAMICHAISAESNHSNSHCIPIVRWKLLLFPKNHYFPKQTPERMCSWMLQSWPLQGSALIHLTCVSL